MATGYEDDDFANRAQGAPHSTGADQPLPSPVAPTEEREAAPKKWDELDPETQAYMVERCTVDTTGISFALAQLVTDYTDPSDAGRLDQTIGVLEMLFDAYQRQSAELTTLRLQLSKAEADRERLLRFAGNALTEVRVNEIGDWDAGDIEYALDDCGLIERVERTVPCGDGCLCAEFYERGDTAECFPITPLGHEAVRAYRAWQDAARTPSDAATGEARDSD